MALKILAQQWKDNIIIPVLVRLDIAAKEQSFLSAAAVNILLGTIAVESNFNWVRQTSGGPGRGFFQIEPDTAQDVLDRTKKFELSAWHIIQEFKSTLSVNDALVSDISFQCAIARMKYYLIPVKLPDADNLKGLADYWKVYYQAGGDAGLPASAFVTAYNKYVQA